MKLSIPKLSFETVLFSLLFLFPLFALGIRHWASTTFSLIVLAGIIYYFVRYRTEPVRLNQYEKWLLWFLGVHFTVFLITMIINPAESISRTQFGNEIRFLLVIPFYLLLTRYQQGLRWLVAGSAVAIVIGFGFCLYEIYFLDKEFFEGIYSKLFTGPVILLYLVIVLVYYIHGLKEQNWKLWAILFVLTVLATFSIIATEVRVAYIAYLFLSLMFILIYIKGPKKIVVLVLLAICMALIITNSESIQSRMTRAYSDLTNYFSKKDPDYNVSDISYAGTSVGARLEMWRVAPEFLKDYPVFGVGNGNYHKTIEKYVREGKVHSDMLLHDHPHNVFLNAVYNKGLLGLVSTCLVFFFPLYIYLATYKQGRNTALIGVFFITTIFFFSMNSVAPFFKSNFIATYLIFGLVIFQNHMASIKHQQVGEKPLDK